MMHYVYLLTCADGTLYCGSTSDLKKRVHAHNHAKAGAHYTKIRRPVTLAYSEKMKTLGEARSREAAIKQLSRTQKNTLIATQKKTVLHGRS